LKLHIVGWQSPEFHLLAKKLGIEKFTVFHGYHDQKTIPRYYNSADICIFPSLHEGFGLVVLEAMACGKPIIASNIGSFQELISHGKNGYLFRTGDAKDLSEAILNLHYDSDLKKNLSRNAYKASIGYDWEKIASMYVSLYGELCD
jgi:glycosyltransferase involved in cell wall biosynthesis